MRISSLILIIAVLLSLNVPSWCAEGGIQAPVSLIPSDAQTILDKATADQAVIDNEANTKRTKVLTAMVEKLKASQDKATKAGKLEASLAIKAEIDKAQTAISALVETKPVGAVKVNPISTSRTVTLYSLPNFKGPGTIIKQLDTVLDVQSVGFPNDALRSIRLPAGYALTVYASERAGGDSYEITEETADLTGTPALGMSSFMVHKLVK